MFLSFADRRSNLSAHKLLVRAAFVFLLFPFDVDARGDPRVAGKEHHPRSSQRTRHAGLHREDAQLHRTAEEASGGPVRVCRHEGHRFAHFRYILID